MHSCTHGSSPSDPAFSTLAADSNAPYHQTPSKYSQFRVFGALANHISANMGACRNTDTERFGHFCRCRPISKKSGPVDSNASKKEARTYTENVDEIRFHPAGMKSSTPLRLQNHAYIMHRIRACQIENATAQKTSRANRCRCDTFRIRTSPDARIA